MATAANLRKRLETLESGPEFQEFKIFCVDEGSDENLTKTQWEAVRAWQKTHPYGRAHIIIFEEVEGRQSSEEQDESD